MFPYPGGMREIVPATYVPVQEVTWKAGAFEQLTTTTITAVKYMLDGVDRHVNVTMTLTPYDGVGTYEMEYDMIKETTEDTTWSQADLETVRTAMWARYEWVKEKVEYINHLRWEAGLQSAEQAAGDDLSANTSEDHMSADISEDDMSADTSEEDEGEAASEEDDPYDCECSSVSYPRASHTSGRQLTRCSGRRSGCRERQQRPSCVSGCEEVEGDGLDSAKTALREEGTRELAQHYQRYGIVTR